MSNGPQSIWFGGKPMTVTNDSDGPGLIYLAIGTTATAAVQTLVGHC